MRVLVLAAVLSVCSAVSVAAQVVPDDVPETRVEDIVVHGRPLREVAREFVAEVGEAPRGRGLARWNRPMCPGVMNLRPPAAQSLVDHVAMRADGLGVDVGAPGCSPNVVFIFSEDPKALASALVDASPVDFSFGPRTFNLSSGALRHFRESDVPVRWWHTSMPVNADTGQRAVRLPGDVDNQGNPTAPTNTVLSSTLSTILRDDLFRIIVIVDAARVADVSPLQLADYLAFVALAQIDPFGDRSGAPSVLNSFDDPHSSEGLSEWDQAYLDELYRPGGSARRDGRAVADGVARGIARSLGRADDGDE